MVVKNLMEDKVIKFAEDYLKGIGKQVDTKLFNDIIVYTLNRVQPQYISSSRGFLNRAFDKENLQTSIDIRRLIDEACTMVQRREADKLDHKIPVIEEAGFYIIHPIIVGNVFYGDNFARVDDAKVTAYRDSAVAKSYSSSFPNPFSVTKHSPGRFVFCFEPERVKERETFIQHITLVTEVTGYPATTTDVILELEATYCNQYAVPSLTTKEIENIYIFND